MTIAQLRDKLQSIIDNLDEYDDDKEVNVVSNTYFLGHPYYFLGMAGRDGGYVNLDNPCDDDEDEEEDW